MFIQQQAKASNVDLGKMMCGISWHVGVCDSVQSVILWRIIRGWDIRPERPIKGVQWDKVIHERDYINYARYY